MFGVFRGVFNCEFFFFIVWVVIFLVEFCIVVVVVVSVFSWDDFFCSYGGDIVLGEDGFCEFFNCYVFF